MKWLGECDLAPFLWVCQIAAAPEKLVVLTNDTSAGSWAKAGRTAPMHG